MDKQKFRRFWLSTSVKAVSNIQAAFVLAVPVPSACLRHGEHNPPTLRRKWRRRMKIKQDARIQCSGQVISDSLIGFFGVDSRSKALGDKLPSFE